MLNKEEFRQIQMELGEHSFNQKTIRHMYDFYRKGVRLGLEEEVFDEDEPPADFDFLKKEGFPFIGMIYEKLPQEVQADYQTVWERYLDACYLLAGYGRLLRLLPSIEEKLVFVVPLLSEISRRTVKFLSHFPKINQDYQRESKTRFYSVWKGVGGPKLERAERLFSSQLKPCIDYLKGNNLSPPQRKTIRRCLKSFIPGFYLLMDIHGNLEFGSDEEYLNQVYLTTLTHTLYADYIWATASLSARIAAPEVLERIDTFYTEVYPSDHR